MYYKVMDMANYSEKAMDLKIKKFYYNEFVKAFDGAAFQTLDTNYYKHVFELSVILNSASKIKKKEIRVLDIGGGIGSNLAILSRVFKCKCVLIDRLEEFSPEHNRILGDYNALIKRLNNYDVEVFKHDFISDGFPFDDGSFDIVTCFDVIEHFNFSPAKFITNTSRLLNKDGYLIVGTPNQAHIINRIKILFGKNIWEDFEYYYNSGDCFYGHVRELTADELRETIHREDNLKYEGIYYSSYPLKRKLQNKSKIIVKIISFIAKLIFKIFPKLNYYMVAVAKN